MNFSVNRFSESPQASGNQPPEEGDNSKKDQSAKTGNSEATSNKPNDTPETSAGENNPAPSGRKQPIPPPTEPRQYRAIGLVKGKYQPSEEQWTRGNVITSDETALDAVLLGRTISLLKNHLDLDEPHLWVVYPRTRQDESEMHVQIVGVWEPETLDRDEEPESSESAESAESDSPQEAPPEIEDGYFSIRGEVIFYLREAEKVVVKIRQSPKRGDAKGKFFKLELKGSLPSDRAVGNFWDLEVQLEGNTLLVKQATDIGPLSSRKNNFRKKGKKYPPKGKSKGRPTTKSEQSASTSSTPKPKPTPKAKKSPPDKTD